MNKDFEIIQKNGIPIAIIVPKGYRPSSTEFFTPGDSPQQFGVIVYREGEVLKAHIHNEIKREISQTQEVVVVKKGKVKANFYDPEKTFLESRILEEGDTVFLASGGHEFKFLEDSELIEVKQGPYLGENDKVRFNGIEEQP